MYLGQQVVFNGQIKTHPSSTDNPRTAAQLPGAQRSRVELGAGCAADTAHLLGRHAGLSLPARPDGPPTKA